MAAEPAVTNKTRLYAWFHRNESRLLATSIISITLLFTLHIFATSIQTFTTTMASILQIVTLVLISLVALSIVWKGVVPAIICAMGITLLHGSIILPTYAPDPTGDAFYKNTFFKDNIATKYFFLGLGMVVLSMLVAYRPSVLFTKNRPESLESIWSKYPVWQDNTKLVGGYEEPSVPVKSLMTDQEKYLLWRYEYVLTDIYATPHLVRPEGMVPKNSVILRDKESGMVIGKAKYTGFFM